MKVAFTGAQGVGKTTLLDIFEKCFTFSQPLEFVRNFTRNIAKAGYNINEMGTDDTQVAIMSAHKDLCTSSANIFMDRCVLDGLVYTTYLYRKDSICKNTLDECERIFKECISKYNLLFYIKPEFPLTGDQYRSSKVDYQQEIAAIFEELIQKYEVPVIQLTGTVGDRLHTALDRLKEITHVNLT